MNREQRRRPGPAQTARRDQERAALAEAKAWMTSLLAEPGWSEAEEIPAGISSAVQAGLQAVLLGLVPAGHCEHNEDSGPALAATATWAANTQVCRDCEHRLRLPKSAAGLCDLCGARRPVEAIARLLAGPLMIRYRLCRPCVTAREARE